MCVWWLVLALNLDSRSKFIISTWTWEGRLYRTTAAMASISLLIVCLWENQHIPTHQPLVSDVPICLWNRLFGHFLDFTAFFGRTNQDVTTWWPQEDSQYHKSWLPKVLVVLSTYPLIPDAEDRPDEGLSFFLVERSRTPSEGQQFL